MAGELTESAGAIRSLTWIFSRPGPLCIMKNVFCRFEVESLAEKASLFMLITSPEMFRQTALRARVAMLS
jgi:hypothetical protein